MTTTSRNELLIPNAITRHKFGVVSVVPALRRLFLQAVEFFYSRSLAHAANHNSLDLMPRPFRRFTMPHPHSTPQSFDYFGIYLARHARL